MERDRWHQVDLHVSIYSRAVSKICLSQSSFLLRYLYETPIINQIYDSNQELNKEEYKNTHYYKWWCINQYIEQGHTASSSSQPILCDKPLCRHRLPVSLGLNCIYIYFFPLSSLPCIESDAPSFSFFNRD